MLNNSMEKICKCGCETKLRKDNSSGYKKSHKPCALCGTLMKSNNIECCSKSCSAKLHWKRNPEMKENRGWNEAKSLVRCKNPNWKNNISKARKEFLANGGEPWNKGKKGLQVAWNKGLPREQQPFYGYEPKNISNLEKEYGELFLSGYEPNKQVTKYRVDFINEEAKHIVEIYGDYWHCNPELFEEDYHHSQLNKTAKEKWEFDNKRKIYLEQLGYIVDVIWETDAKLQIKDYRNKQ